MFAQIAMRFCLSLILIAVSAPVWAGTPHGFADVRVGSRLQDNPYQDDLSLGEARLQLDWNHFAKGIEFQVKLDLYHDEVALSRAVDLEEGRGWLDLREANMLFSPTSMMDVKVGRQILTWGTGDLVFIADTFPKDWQAFFSGRDVAYLKAPSDAVFVSFFPGWANIDIAYTPRFDSDRYIDGSRNSYWNPFLGRTAGQDAIIDPLKPDDVFSDDEIAVRLSRNFNGWETAFYAYDGFWKSPNGFDPASGRATFHPLQTFAASLRGALGKGLFHVETGFYDSRDYRKQAVPSPAPNRQIRFLSGYEWEAAKNLTAAVQYYLEWIQDHDSMRLDPAMLGTAPDEMRHLLTLRFTKQAMEQKLTLSWFNYWSPSDEDGYARPSVKYKLTDAWELGGGANWFWGKRDHTFFGQFEKNSNLYVSARYSF